MKRAAIEEQKAAAQLKRERFRALCKKVRALSDDERKDMARRMPGVLTCEGHALSLHNTILLYFQGGAVTVVGGFRQWKKLGRYVRKGEHGMSIWIPVDRKAPATVQPTGDAELDDMFFIAGTVFDVSQTEATTGAPQLDNKTVPQLEAGIIGEAEEQERAA